MKTQFLILCLAVGYILAQDCLKENERIKGKLLAKTKKNSAEECLALCEDTEGCLGMAYITTEHTKKKLRGRCYTYKKIKKTIKSSNIISAIIKDCTTTDMCIGHYQESPTLNITSPETLKSGSCGVENKPDHRISGGSETDENQYPWMVRLPMGCGGSLITDRHVITAKHCVLAWGIDWRGKMVKFSVHNQYDPNDHEEVAIKDYVMPDPKEVGFHDIAIIILEKAVDLSDNTIGTVCLPTSEDKDYREKCATAMGWGMTTVDSSQHPVLKHVSLKVSHYQRRNFLYTEVPVVNGVPQDPCAGDSGGPLVHKDAETGRWTVIGTVYGGGYDCRTGKINGKGVWNKVTDHLAWIQQIIED